MKEKKYIIIIIITERKWKVDETELTLHLPLQCTFYFFS